MIDIAYYDDAIYVINNTQNNEVESDINPEDEITFCIRVLKDICRPAVYWDDTTYEDYDGEETEYNFVLVEIPFGWTGKIPIRDRDKQELDFKVDDDNNWLTVVDEERIRLC